MVAKREGKVPLFATKYLVLTATLVGPYPDNLLSAQPLTNGEGQNREQVHQVTEALMWCQKERNIVMAVGRTAMIKCKIHTTILSGSKGSWKKGPNLGKDWWGGIAKLDK